MDIKIIRIKQVGTGFSVLATDGITERGFTFPLGRGWEELQEDGDPKYLNTIEAEYEKIEAIKDNAVASMDLLQQQVGKTFKRGKKVK